MQWHWRCLNIKEHPNVGRPTLAQEACAFLEQPGVQSWLCCLTALQRAWAGSSASATAWAFSTFCTLRTASWHASACLHHTDFDFSTTIREPGINEKKDFESLKELACKPELMWWSRVVLCAAAAPQFPSMPPSLFKDGISVLHCILQHQHTHCLLLFDSSCAQGNRSFININSLVSEHFVDLESIVSLSVASPQATDSSNVYQKK